MFGDTVTVLRAQQVANRYTDANSSVPDWTDPTATVVAGVSVQPIKSQSGRSAGGGTRYGAIAETTVSEVRLFTQPGVDIDVTARDRIVYNGHTYMPTGEPVRWPDPRKGGVHHLEMTLRRVEG